MTKNKAFEFCTCYKYLQIYIYIINYIIIVFNIDHFDLLRSLQADRSNLGITPLLHGTLGFLNLR